MRPRPIGPVNIATSGTPQTLYSGLAAPAQEEFSAETYRCHIIRIKAFPGNTGNIAIGVAGMNQATGAGVIEYLTKDSPAFELRGQAGNELKVTDYRIDASANDQKATVAVFEN